MSNPIHPTSQTPQDITLAQLKQIMPEAFSEGQLDIRKLTALLSEQDIAPAQEAYGLSWAGKHQVYRELKTPTSQTLVPAPDESVDFDTSQNLFIEGDNLAVLKILQKSYHSRIKMIYIDPPYNTGNDRFVYADDFSESIADYKARAGQTDEDGNLTHSDGMQANRKENGQYHSNWLNMMYPRLALAKSLLRDDGVIFVSIDDNEVANLRLLMDEIFGEENFVGQIIWKNVTDNNPTNIATEHEYIVVYSRNKAELEGVWKSSISASKTILLEKEKELLESFEGDQLEEEYRKWFKENKSQLGNLDRYRYIDEGGIYIGSQSVHNPGKEGYRYDVIHPVTGKPCKEPLMGYRFPQETMDKLLQSDKIIFGEDENKIIELKVYVKDFLEKLSSVETTDGRSGAYDIRTLFDDVKVFNNPKPISLLEKYFSFILKDNDIILDFFAGSASTAHAIMALNAEAIKNSENHKFGNRKFIMVQIPEDIDPESKDYKSAYEFCVNNNMPPNIAEISKERIRRAAAHITSELPESVDSKALDFGFKAYKLADSNFIPWQQPASYDADSLMAQLEQHLDPIVDTATTDGIITELMLKEGYTLTAIVSEGDGYYLVTQNDALHYSNDNADSSESAGISMSLAIVLDDMTTSKATQIITTAPNKTLIMDRAFSDDANKANIVLQFEDAGLVVGCV
ncbi:site-specific DNA-methyltransferase [Psychrobacter sp. DM8]|uniref:site-specific DNA-methyltransferase n=1 Tax=Psychrobacter sp. DM8 TaxID=3440636 RepID=UPI003F500CE5